MNTQKTNLSESIYARLKKLAIAKQRPTQEILRYYAMERFIFRLSKSSYRDSFFLKGGLMFMVWDPESHRATVDIDLLARSENSISTIAKIIREICSTQVQEDGVVFDLTNLVLTESQMEMEYNGLSARFSTALFTAKFPLRIDIGFSDTIFPQPDNIEYPTLLDFPSPQLKGYTPETMIAEKLDAIIKLGLGNSRMKDFYDIFILLKRFQIQPENMAPIIHAVLQNRGTILQDSPIAFSEDFYQSPKKIAQWNAFLMSIGEESITLEEVIREVRDFFLPIIRPIPLKA